MRHASRPDGWSASRPVAIIVWRLGPVAKEYAGPRVWPNVFPPPEASWAQHKTKKPRSLKVLIELKAGSFSLILTTNDYPPPPHLPIIQKGPRGGTVFYVLCKWV